jgi:Phosphatidylglycerophosphate synthase
VPTGREVYGGLTIPNFITLVRFLLVPAVVFALLSGRVGWAFAGFVAAALSDGVDGFIARQFNQRSDLGAYLDPIADKLLLVSVFVVLGYMGHLPLWLVVAAVSRDGLIVGGVVLSAVMGNPVAMKPLLVSKANTLAQLLLASLVLAGLSLSFSLGIVYGILVYLSGLLTIASGAAYLVGWIKHMGGYVDTGTPKGQG